MRRTMKKLFITILMLSAVASFAQSTLYPLPASWSFRAVASFSQPRIVATTTETPIASAGTMTSFSSKSGAIR